MTRLQPIKLICEGLPVAAIAAELAAAPDLWNAHRARTEHPDSPHHGLDDIWARWALPGTDTSCAFDAEWYPQIRERLPAVVDAAEQICWLAGGCNLAGVLITRIPAGRECRPHRDGGWHAQHHQKFALQIAAHPGQVFGFDECSLATKPGDLFWFDNAHKHWVTNPTPHDRVTLIVCTATNWSP